MANTSSFIEFYNSEGCPYLEEVAWRDEFLLTEGTYSHLVTIISINSISVLPTVLLNALVIFAVATRERLRNKSTILLACLSGADLLTGLVGQPIRIAVEVERILKKGTFCGALERVSFVSDGCHIFATLTHLVLITIDRYIAVKKPLRYQEIVTTRRVICGALSAWGFTIYVTIQESILATVNRASDIYNVYNNVSFSLLTAFGLICIVFIVGVYLYIFSETRRQQRTQTEHLRLEEIRTIRKNNKAAKTLGIILVVLTATYLPAIIVIILGFSVSLERHVSNRFAGWAATLIMLGSLCNPVIYCWRMKRLRRAFLQILHLGKQENNQPQEAIQMPVIAQVV